MKYNNLTIQIPEEEREEHNKKIIDCILCNGQELTAEEIYNLYTGKGKLHHLNREDFSNYYEFSEAKKEIEQGQFFTPHDLCCDIMRAIQPEKDFTVADLTCGMGNFFNFLPNEQNLYGNEIDPEVFYVCKFLYPNAHL